MPQREYQVYKGLQRPLVFKMFKGKFIYWAMASVLVGILIGGITSAAVNSILGVFLMLIITGAGMAFTLSKQKDGLYNKSLHNGSLIFPPKCLFTDE